MKLRNPFSIDTRVLFIDAYACFDCGRSDRGLELHHIRGRISNEPTNAMPICTHCHSRVGHTEEEHLKYEKLTKEWLDRQ